MNQYQLARTSGDFARSEIFLRQILESKFEIPDNNLALVHNALGYVYYEIGTYSKKPWSNTVWPKSLVSRNRSRHHFSSGSASISILEYSTMALGDYTSALEYNNEAERLLRQIPVWDDISYGKLSALLLNKGITLYHLGNFEEAREVLNECAEIKKRHQHPYLGSVYFNLARVYQSLEDPDLSKENYLLGIRQWISEYDSTYYELANIYLYLGEFLSGQGQAEQGFEYLQKALQNYRLNYGPIHPLTAASYEALARHKMDQDEWGEALDYLQLALHSLTGDFVWADHFSNPLTESSRNDLTLLQILATKTEALEAVSIHAGNDLEKLAYLEAALSTNLLSIQVLERIQSSFLSGESRLYLTSRQKDLFTAGIRLRLALFDLTGRKEQMEEAFFLAAKGKSSELLFEMKVKEWLYLESLSDTSAIVATELKEEVEHLSNLIRTETMALHPDSVQILSWQNELFHTRDSFNRHMEQLRQELPQISHFETDNADITMDRIRRNLKRNETLVEYFLAGTDDAGRVQLFIFVLTKGGIQVHRSSLDNTLYKQVETVVEQLHHFVPYRETEERFDSLKLALFGLYQKLVEPVEPLFRGKNLLIVPDEMLSYVPFDALITRVDSDSILNYAGISYLLKQYNISYMYNSHLIRGSTSRGLRFPEVLAWIPEQATNPANGFGKLQGAEEEVRDILELVRGRRVPRSVQKEELAGLLQENSILHLAMHSLASENRGSSPYFMLDTLSDPLLANRMHDYEINGLNLVAPMVVLSSCETAGGQLHIGEGVMSLSRSFLQAGAASVVHTLWPVDDAKSREIMVGFYEEIQKGKSKSRALSYVKREYLEQHPPFYTHPYYWAAFQITGDDSALNSKRRVPYILGTLLFVLLIGAYLKRRSFRMRA